MDLPLFPRFAGAPGDRQAAMNSAGGRALHRLHMAHLEPFEAPEPGGEVAVVLRGDDAQHARRVRRARAGEAVEILDGRGTVLGGAVAPTPERSLPRDGLAVQIASVRREPEPARVEVVACAPKPAVLGVMIDMLAQVGVSAWVPLGTERSGDAGRVRTDKLERVAREASKQCGRAWDLEIAEPVTFAQALDGLANRPGSCWYAHMGGTAVLDLMRTVVSGASAADAVASVLVGPEGGWSPDELRALGARGVPALGLGAHVLRIETAAVVAGAALRGLLESEASGGPNGGAREP